MTLWLIADAVANYGCRGTNAWINALQERRAVISHRILRMRL
jgi:hypothetical protein